MSNFQIQFFTVQKAGNIRLSRLVVPDIAHGLMKLFFISAHKKLGGFPFQPPFFALRMTERFALLVVVNIRGHCVQPCSDRSPCWTSRTSTPLGCCYTGKPNSGIIDGEWSEISA